MGLLDEFRNERARAGTPCRVAVVRDTMNADDLVALDDAMKDHTITAAAIERVLARKGIRLTATSITRHRRQECIYGK